MDHSGVGISPGKWQKERGASRVDCVHKEGTKGGQRSKSWGRMTVAMKRVEPVGLNSSWGRTISVMGF